MVNSPLPMYVPGKDPELSVKHTIVNLYCADLQKEVGRLLGSEA